MDQTDLKATPAASAPIALLADDQQRWAAESANSEARPRTGPADRRAAARERYQDRDRQFRRRLFVIFQPARPTVRGAEGRSVIRPRLRHRRHERGTLSDGDRSSPSLRQRRGGRGGRDPSGSAGADGDGLRFRPRRAHRAAHAEATFLGAVAPAHAAAARRVAERDDEGRRDAGGARGVAAGVSAADYLPGSLNGALVPSGSGAAKVLSVIETIA
jgi:hypothetical protein